MLGAVIPTHDYLISQLIYMHANVVASLLPNYIKEHEFKIKY